MLEQQQPDMFDEGLTFQQVRETVFAYAGAFIVWCLVALVLAGFAMARRDWARRGLMIIAAFSAGGCLVFVHQHRPRPDPRRGRRGDRRVPAAGRGPPLVLARSRADADNRAHGEMGP